MTTYTLKFSKEISFEEQQTTISYLQHANKCINVKNTSNKNTYLLNTTEWTLHEIGNFIVMYLSRSTKKHYEFKINENSLCIN